MTRQHIFTPRAARRDTAAKAASTPARPRTPLRLSACALALVFAALASQTAARAADRTHLFLHNEFDNNRCWDVSGKQRTAPELVARHPHAPGANASPNPSLFGDAIERADTATPFADPQLAVSPNYVLVLEAHSYVFYDRSTNRPLDPHGGCVPLNATASDLFAPLLLPRDPVTGEKNQGDVNYVLELGRGAKYPCDPEHYLNKKGAPLGGCVQGNYDARAYYDNDTGRFWIVAAARNRLYKCPNKKPCGPEARRYVFVAVSKTEDPRDGFWEYVLVRDYSDWPLFSVRNGRLLITHANHGKRLYVFDANKLVAGTNTDPFIAQYNDEQFPESSTITPVTQYSDAGGLNLVLGRKGNALTVYALKDTPAPLFRKTVVLVNPPGWAMQPVYRFEKFYFAEEACEGGGCKRRRVDVHRVTAELSASKVGEVKDDYFAVAEKKASLRMPGVLIEENGAAVVWYQRFPTDGRPQQARYRVLYPGEADFRHSALLRASDTAQASKGFVGDRQIGGAAEPGKLGFWITHIYSDSDGATLQTLARVDAPAKP